MRVTAVLTTQGQTRNLFLVLVQTRTSWRIANLGHGGRGLEALIPVWRQHKKAVPQATLVDWWEQLLAQTLAAKYPSGKGE